MKLTDREKIMLEKKPDIFFEGYRHLIKKRDELLIKKVCMLESFEGGAIELSFAPSWSSYKESMTEDQALRILKVDNDIVRCQHQINRRRAVIRSVVFAHTTDQKVIRLLFNMYLSGYSMEKSAKLAGLSYRWAREKRKNFFEKLAQKGVNSR